jgi:ubiquinone/menaquinone biosynthesis C-methylase UbiE
MSDRANFIADYLARCFAPSLSLLEIGAGKGHIARALQEKAKVRVKLVDVVDYNETDLDLEVYNGVRLPFEDNAFDYSLLIFVLHHTPEPLQVLVEALRVSRGGVVIVENHVQGWLRRVLTRSIDSLPHFRHGVPICYHTNTIDQWQHLFSELPVTSELLGRFTLDGFWQNFIMRLNCPRPD